MTGKALALASAACALALAAAGCGGNGTVAGTTTSGQGGVLGAQANLTRTRANVEIARVQAILNGSLGRLMHARSAKQASRLATETSARLRAEAGRIQALDVPPDAVQARQNLVSSIQSLATDLDTVKGDLQSGDLKSAVRAGTHLSSVIAVRSSLKSFRAALQGG